MDKGVDSKRIVIQDATFIIVDQGTSEPPKPRVATAMTNRSRDCIGKRKLNRAYFDFKMNVKTELKYDLISAFKATTASVHDS
jgi:hypothetical protein